MDYVNTSSTSRSAELTQPQLYEWQFHRMLPHVTLGLSSVESFPTNVSSRSRLSATNANACTHASPSNDVLGPGVGAAQQRLICEKPMEGVP
jgi:hypothetical protein